MDQWDTLYDIARDQYDEVENISDNTFEFINHTGTTIKVWYDGQQAWVDSEHIEYLEDLMYGAKESGEW
jgi:hypothetical protein